MGGFHHHLQVMAALPSSSLPMYRTTLFSAARCVFNLAKNASSALMPHKIINGLGIQAGLRQHVFNKHIALPSGSRHPRAILISYA